MFALFDDILVVFVEHKQCLKRYIVRHWKSVRTGDAKNVECLQKAGGMLAKLMCYKSFSGEFGDRFRRERGL